MEKWSQLPSDLLFRVSDRLGVPDLLRFGAVCRSWQSVMDERRRLRLSHLQVPWLWFNTLRKGKQFYRPAEFDNCCCRFYSIKRPAEQETNCIGSGYGWIVITYKTREISLFNPITGREIQLPHFSTFLPRLRTILERPFELKDFDFEYMDRRCYKEGEDYRHGFVVSQFIIKAILTSSPDGNDCVVFLFPGDGPLAYARPGDKAWTVVGDSIYMHIINVTCHQGKIYTSHTNGGIVSWDFSGSQLKPTIVIKAKLLVDCPICFVSSPSGDLLYANARSLMPQLAIEVYKADFEKQELVKLISLGEHAIFMLPNSSICLSLLHLPHLQRDCIYFRDDGLEEILDRQLDGDEIGIYNLKDGAIQFSKLGELTTQTGSMTWFLPSLIAYD